MDADSLRGFHDKFKELAGEERTLLEKLEKREILPGSPEERILQVRPEDRWLRAHGDYSTDILGGVAEAIRRLPPNERRKAWARERSPLIQGRGMTAKQLGKYPGDKWVERLAQPAKPECGRWHLCGGSSEGIRAQFVALATQAGKALDPPQGTAPLDFWLHSLFLYLRKSSSHELQGADETGGIIRHVCEPSATFCSHLEAEALRLERLQVREEAPAMNRGDGTTHLRGQEKNKPKHLLMPTKATPKGRAQTVAQVIAELNTLRPQMYGEASYEELKEHHPDFLTFKVSEERSDLKLLLLNIQQSKRHFRLAQQCAAHYHGRQLETVESDWKHHKPENFRSRKSRKTRRKKA